MTGGSRHVFSVHVNCTIVGVCLIGCSVHSLSFRHSPLPQSVASSGRRGADSGQAGSAGPGFMPTWAVPEDHEAGGDGEL